MNVFVCKGHREFFDLKCCDLYEIKRTKRVPMLIIINIFSDTQVPKKHKKFSSFANLWILDRCAKDCFKKINFRNLKEHFDFLIVGYFSKCFPMQMDQGIKKKNRSEIIASQKKYMVKSTGKLEFQCIENIKSSLLIGKPRSYYSPITMSQGFNQMSSLFP